MEDEYKEGWILEWLRTVEEEDDDVDEDVDGKREVEVEFECVKGGRGEFA